MQRGLRMTAVVAGAALAASVLAGCTGSAEGKPVKSTPSCPAPVPKPTAPIDTKTIHVNIINASSTGGLGSRTSTQLAWRGFRVLSTENQSVMDDRPAPRAAEIRYGSIGRQIALTLATQVANPTLVQIDRADPTVDLVLGTKFGLVPVPPPPASKVTLNVFNTTYRSGLSGQASAQLKERGFVIKRTGNDPGGSFLPDDVALIRHGEQGEPAARRVLLQVKGARLQEDGREGTGVDLLLGNKYAALVPEAQATVQPPAPPKRPAGC